MLQGLARTLVIGLGCFAIAVDAAPATPSRGAVKDWELVVIRLYDVRDDYNETVEANDVAVKDEIAESVDDLVAWVKGMGPAAAPRLEALHRIRALIASHGSPIPVEKEITALTASIIETEKIPRAPKQKPDLARAAKLFQVNCVPCHGVDGKANGEVAKNIDPPPTNLADSGNMNLLTAFQIYGGITHGVPPTAMPSFPHLSDQDRWSLAFYALTFSQPPCSAPPVLAPIEELAISSNGTLVAKYGEPSTACFRRLKSGTIPVSAKQPRAFGGGRR